MQCEKKRALVAEKATRQTRFSLEAKVFGWRHSERERALFKTLITQREMSPLIKPIFNEEYTVAVFCVIIIEAAAVVWNLLFCKISSLERRPSFFRALFIVSGYTFATHLQLRPFVIRAYLYVIFRWATLKLSSHLIFWARRAPRTALPWRAQICKWNAKRLDCQILQWSGGGRIPRISFCAQTALETSKVTLNRQFL